MRHQIDKNNNFIKQRKFTKNQETNREIKKKNKFQNTTQQKQQNTHIYTHNKKTTSKTKTNMFHSFKNPIKRKKNIPVISVNDPGSASNTTASVSPPGTPLIAMAAAR